MTASRRGALVLIAVAALVSGVLTQEDPAAAHRRALAYGRAGQWDIAAGEWQEAAVARTAGAASPSDRRLAARTLVMAAIAWERAGDRRAYAAWSDAVRLFLESGTTWAEERRQFKASVEQVDSALRQAPGGPGRIPFTGGMDLLQLDLDRELSFGEYDGPRPGLDAAPIPGAASDEVLFLPRALVPTAALRAAVTAERDQVPDEPANLMRHGVIDPDPSAGPDPRAERVGAVPQFGFDVPVPALEANVLAPYAVLAAPVTAMNTDFNRDLTAARTAWRYVERNLQTKTGLVSAVAGYPHATMWDIGSALAALACAEQLHVIDRDRYLALAGSMLGRLATLPLYNNELPNREYDVASMTMLDTRSQASAVGSGWSALDLGRLLTWLHITREWYPELTSLVTKVTGRWNLGRLVRSGELYGVLREEGLESLRQEGRLGYEQYAGAAMQLWGLDAAKARGSAHRAYVTVEGVRIPHDTRSHAFLTSEPFMLAALEFGGISADFAAMTRAIYDVQRHRSIAAGRLVAVSEDSLSREPWFVYNTIWHSGTEWASVSPSGRRHDAQRSLSTKAAWAWHAVYGDDYSRQLVDATLALSSPDGFVAGRYDDGSVNTALNINTNAVILEALLYEARGGRSFIARPDSGSSR
jgi:hypothetical protein